MGVGRHGSWKALAQADPKEIVVNTIELAVLHMPGVGELVTSPKMRAAHFLLAKLASDILEYQYQHCGLACSLRWYLRG